MPNDSVVAGNADSCEYSKGGKEGYKPQDSLGAEDGGSC